MKKNYYFKFILLAIPCAAFLLMSNSRGRTAAANSGSPGDNNQTCAQCHSGGNFGAEVAISHDIPVTGYELNTLYNITVQGSSSAPAHGFQLTAETQENNAKIGSLVAGNNTRLTSSGSNITHTNSNNSSWSFQWRSPATDQGRVVFYAALNAVNGNGRAFDGQDQTVTTNTEFIPSLSISDSESLDFNTFPNPASDQLNIQLPSDSNDASVQFYDFAGRLVLSNKVSALNTAVNVSDLNKGVYLLKVTSNGQIGSQKFIKN